MSLFEILKSYTYNTELIKLLTEFEKGIFGNFSYDKCILGMNGKSVNLSQLSTSKSIEENGKIFNDFLIFLDACGWKKEISPRKNTSCDSDDAQSHCDWKKQKKDNKDRLIHHFILNMKNRYNLTFSEQTKLENLISINIKLNYISSQHIIIENNEIVEIKNLIFDQYNREWKIDTVKSSNASSASNASNVSSVSSTSSEINKIYAKIDKYLEFRKII